jgi:hypothetical protein
LDSAARTDADALLNLDERPDGRLVADFAPVEIYEGVKPDVLAELDVRSDALEEPVALLGVALRQRPLGEAPIPLIGTTAPP